MTGLSEGVAAAVSTATGFVVSWLLMVLLALQVRRFLRRDDTFEVPMWTYVFAGITFSSPWGYFLASSAHDYPPMPFWAFLGGVGMGLLTSAGWPILALYYQLLLIPAAVKYDGMPSWTLLVPVAFVAGSLVLGWLLGRYVTGDLRRREVTPSDWL